MIVLGKVHEDHIEGKIDIGKVYSNFDHELNKEVAEKLKEDKNLCARHYAWDFCGNVWYMEGKYFNLINRYGHEIDVIMSPSIEECINLTIEKHGNK